MSQINVEIRPYRRGKVETCEYISPDKIYWSRGPVLLSSDTLDGQLNQVCRLRRPLLGRVLSCVRLGRRLARETFYNVLPMGDGSLFFSYGTEIGLVLPDGTIRYLSGRARKHRILRGGVARLPDGALVFGEYFDNAERDAVHLYRLTPGADRVEEIHRFAPGAVRHIHSVRWDDVSKRAVVSTGDIDSECRILAFTPNFSEHTVLGQGTEDWRTISPQFSEDAIYFGTDAQFSQNRLFRYDRSSETLSPLADVNGPIFYSVAFGNGWVFATSAELCQSQTSPEAILYYIDSETNTVIEIDRFQKDRLPTRYFQFGMLNFPIVECDIDTLPVSGTALSGLDGQFVLLTLGASQLPITAAHRCV